MAHPERLVCNALCVSSPRAEGAGVDACCAAFCSFLHQTPHAHLKSAHRHIGSWPWSNRSACAVLSSFKTPQQQGEKFISGLQGWLRGGGRKVGRHLCCACLAAACSASCRFSASCAASASLRARLRSYSRRPTKSATPRPVSWGAFLHVSAWKTGDFCWILGGEDS